MSNIRINNLTFCYDGSYDSVFTNLNLTIDSDWKLGLTARNGRGKTTLLKLLEGKLKGSGAIESNLIFKYFPFDIDILEKTGLDVVTEVYPDLNLWELEKELNLLNVDSDILYSPFKQLSQGERAKILIGTMFLDKGAFYLIDEPTNHLDIYGREALGRYLNDKKSFIIASHDINFMDNCVDHILALNNSGAAVYQCDMSTYLMEKENQILSEKAENEQLTKEISRLDIAKRKTKQWSDSAEREKYGGTLKADIRPDRGYIGAKSAKMMKRSKAIEFRIDKKIDEKKNLLKDLETTEAIMLNYYPYHKEILVSVKDLSLTFGDKKVIKNLNFDFKKGKKIAVIGKNGCGKSSLLKIILGEITHFQGELVIPQSLKISYVNQNTSHLCGSLSDYVTDNLLEESRFKAILRKLGFERTQFDKDINSYSEGQKKKLLLANSLCKEANIYIWDEPLNYIDVLSRLQIQEMLSAGCSMIFVEHDRKFVNQISDEILILDD